VLLAFVDDIATPGMDFGYDAANFDDNPSDMYFYVDGNKLVIQGDGTFDENNSYPIGLVSDVEGAVKFILDDLENFEDDQAIYIHDALDGTDHNIRTEDYEVILPIGEYNERFSLRFKTEGSSSVTDDTDVVEGIIVSFDNTAEILQINNNSADTTIEMIRIYSILGQTIKTITPANPAESLIQIPMDSRWSGMFIAKIITSKGTIIKKLITK
jgi:hypothetical protein